MWEQRFPNGARIVLPEDPQDREDAAVFFSYTPDGDLASGLFRGDPCVLGDLMIHNIKTIGRELDPESKRLFIKGIGEAISEIAQGTDGINVVIMRRGNPEEEACDEPDEDD